MRFKNIAVIANAVQNHSLLFLTWSGRRMMMRRRMMKMIMRMRRLMRIMRIMRKMIMMIMIMMLLLTWSGKRI